MQNSENRAKNVKDPEVVADFLLTEGTCKKKFREPITQEEFFSRLDKMLVDNYIVPARDKKTWVLLSAKAKRKKMTPEEYIISVGYDCSGIKRARKKSPLVTDDDYRQCILECTDKNGKVSLLDKKYRVVTYRIGKIAKENQISFEDAINLFMGVEKGTYKYNQRSSVFGFGRLSISGDDAKVNERVEKMIRDCMDENGYVVNLHSRSHSVFNVVSKLSDLRGLTFEEALRIFVPEANYRSYNTSEDYPSERVVELLRTYSDPSGCVDSLKSNGVLLYHLMNMAKANGLTMSEQLETLGGFHFSKETRNVDIYDYIKVSLDAIFYPNTDASGLLGIDEKLYSRISAYRYGIPGGATKSVEEMLNYFGYTYNGKARPTKFTYEYVEKLLKDKYKEQTKIKNIYEDKNVGNAIFYFSGKIGKSIPEALKLFGYDYGGTAGQNTHKCLVLSNAEYNAYLRHKKAMEEREALEKNSKPLKNTSEEVDETYDPSISKANLFDDEPGGNE